LCSMRSDGTAFATLVSGSVRSSAVWLPNSTALVFVCNAAVQADPYGAKNDICFVHSDGSGFVDLTASAGVGADNSPSVSPLSH
jgi:hypothetical protein